MRLLPGISIASSVTRVELICKYGADGSSGHSEYMQKPTTTNEQEISDTHLFLITFVPLRLVGYSDNMQQVDDTKGEILWRNPRPSSTRLCRPIKFLYAKETTELIRQEINSLKTQIEKLHNIDITVNETQTIHCKATMHLTMLDVKVINALTDTGSTQTCYLCNAKPTEMNDLSNEKHKRIKTANLQYGLTTMHAWIKFLEYVLHISYKLEFKKTIIRNKTPEQQKALLERQRRIQKELHEKLGIRVDKVIQGKGTSNTGNVSRTFFTNYKISAEITGVDVEIIRRLGLIMIALSSGYNLNIGPFEDFAKETAQLCVSKYDWYYMPVSVHKILVHGSTVAESMLLPIGLMSEEAQEASNKVYRRVRERHTRKMSREKTTTDLVNIMLQQSDPLISKIRGIPVSNKKELPPEVLPLIITEGFD